MPAMAALALMVCVVYAAALFGAGEVVQRRRTGSRGWARAATSTEYVANRIVFAAWLLDLLGPALVLGGAIEPLFDDAEAQAAGAVIAGLSLMLAVVAQRAMGGAWRTGIDPGRPSELVTTGLLALVRNPIYTTMIGVSLGVAVLVPTPLGVLGIATALIGLELQTRLVEEPHLRALHGEPYERYAARAGRFLPGIGRLRPRRPSRWTSL
jgi:protein-S-isoprenylcysteine O-methyltransferase Ste14